MGGTKKEFRTLNGVPVLALALRPFLAGARRAVVTLPPGRLAEAAVLLEAHVDPAALTLVEGGDTRQESVLRGLLALADDPPDLVLIHDGARPWLSADLLARVLAATERHGACVPVLEASEAVKEIDPGRDAGAAALVRRHLPRHTIALAQTPQGFSYPAILAAHERARAEGLSFVDDAEVYARFAGPVAWVPGDVANRKITFVEDLEEDA
jgi:2-C-methyl-D-erythritol 4-phosphate cytidylyltransferase/2-C-methyl-D-erythritol 4-phosphate cytidylyltransferase/2-C-methyl-D-erythritol 2,4-cyclodiphosphate synthase